MFGLDDLIKQLRIPELMVQKYTPTHKDALAALKETLENDVGISSALKTYHDCGQGSASRPADSRTAASPDFSAGGPHNFRRRAPNLSEIAAVDFEIGNTLPVCM